jgi:hypothetical protein
VHALTRSSYRRRRIRRRPSAFRMLPLARCGPAAAPAAAVLPAIAVAAVVAVAAVAGTQLPAEQLLRQVD